MNYLTGKEVLACHEAAVNRFGGTQDVFDAIRVKTLIGRVARYAIDKNVQDPFLLAAMYCVAIVQGNLFTKGNKCTAACVMLALLARNGIHLLYGEELLGAVLKVSQRSMTFCDLAEVLRKRKAL